MKKKFSDLRDVSPILQVIRDILLGRNHTLHIRNPNTYSPRSIPVPDIPRGPNKYSADQYFTRSAYDSVHPPVVAPVASGPKLPGMGRIAPDCIQFSCTPTPGEVWLWDHHEYYENVPDRKIPDCQ